MSEIFILPEPLINKIAAGEVIERPASVVRELIDNSIDADATRIDVEIIHGGKKLIKVSDNGNGMDRDDALLSLERHATSKLRTEDELFSISTLGFRGEALPAIASVSKVIITTSYGNDHTGTMVEVGAGGKKKVMDAPPLKGTIVEVRDLFYNTPARRKFLKSISTELSHIIDTVTQRAFAYNRITFSLLHNNNELITVQETDSLRGRFIQLYGEEFVSEFTEVENIATGIKIYGFISFPEFIRARRGHQFIFINRRAVRNPVISHAIYSAYGEALPKGKHPAFFVFLEIEPSMVDVNVHPAKMEVRFESPDGVHRCVEKAVYNALHRGKEEKFVYPAVSMDNINNALSVREDVKGGFTGIQDMTAVRQTDFFTEGIASTPRRYFHIGDSFIAWVTDEGLMIVDQHAAHERVLYERFLRKTDTGSEPLFLPIRVGLPLREYNIILRHGELFQEIGLEIEDFGGRDVIVRAMPRELQRADMKGLLLDIASGILEEETSGMREKEALARSISARLACHKSVRGREPLNDEEINSMLSELERCSEPERCPHGRPTRILISMEDLRRMFKRR